MKKDIDIIYQIFEEKVYLDSEALKIKVAQIKNATFATGILVDLVVKCEKYQIDPEPIRNIFINEGYNFLDPYESHVEYIKALLKDPRSPLEDFLYEFKGDLAENEDFLKWCKDLNEEELKIVEEYCLNHEYYEVIDFIIKYRSGEYE